MQIEEYRIRYLVKTGEVYGTVWRENNGDSELWVTRAKSMSDVRRVWVEWRYAQIN